MYNIVNSESVHLAGNLMDHWLFVEFTYNGSDKEPVKAYILHNDEKRLIDLNKMSGYNYDCILSSMNY